MRFLEMCLNNTASPSQIDDFVDAWHKGDGHGYPLHEYLGLTDGEYAKWVQGDVSLIDILASHRKLV